MTEAQESVDDSCGEGFFRGEDGFCHGCETLDSLRPNEDSKGESENLNSEEKLELNDLETSHQGESLEKRDHDIAPEQLHSEETNTTLAKEWDSGDKPNPVGDSSNQGGNEENRQGNVENINIEIQCDGEESGGKNDGNGFDGDDDAQKEEEGDHYEVSEYANEKREMNTNGATNEVKNAYTEKGQDTKEV